MSGQPDRRPPKPADDKHPGQLTLDVRPPPVYPPDFQAGEKAVFNAFPADYGKAV